MILLNYTDSCVLLFSNLVFYSFFVFSGKFTTSISTFATAIPQLSRIFPEKLFLLTAWFHYFTNVRAQLFPHRQFSLYFLMNIETTRLQQSIIFNLYSIATYNKHLFTIILIIHVFAIFHRTTDIYFLYIHLFCFGIKIVKQCLFFFFTYRRFS